MNSRREFVKTSLLGASAMAFGGQTLSAAATSDRPPVRFIFLSKGNGLLPSSMVPPTLSEKEKGIESSKDPLEIDLEKHALPGWMRPLDDHKENMTILQGLSGKMCTTGHNAWQSALGAFRATRSLTSVKRATIDFELAKLTPSPFGHIEFACFATVGAAARKINGIGRV